MEYRAFPAAYPSSNVYEYSDAYIPNNTYSMQNFSMWYSDWRRLCGQIRYLNTQLSNTVTRLHALRDRQTRNERALNANPSPRSKKKKKILQDKWRTGKTIQTCENEEKVLLGNLVICEDNITTLLALFYWENRSVTADYQSSIGCTSAISFAPTEGSGFDWKPLADDAPNSPSLDEPEYNITIEDIAPEVASGDAMLGEPNQYSWLPSPHPHTSAPRIAHPTLRPKATVFEPSTIQTLHPYNQKANPKMLDKLSIPVMLASTHIQPIYDDQSLEVSAGCTPIEHKDNNSPLESLTLSVENWDPMNTRTATARKRSNSM